MRNNEIAALLRQVKATGDMSPTLVARIDGAISHLSERPTAELATPRGYFVTAGKRPDGSEFMFQTAQSVPGAFPLYDTYQAPSPLSDEEIADRYAERL
jgi:hypothetical protein